MSSVRKLPEGDTAEQVLADDVTRLRRELDDLRGTALARLAEPRPGWEPLHAETITGATNFPIEPGVYEQLRVTLVGNMTTSPGYPLVLLNDGLNSSDYRTSGYTVNQTPSLQDGWAVADDFWRPGEVSTAVGAIEMTIFGDQAGGVAASGLKRYMGRSWRNASATSFRAGHTQGATNVSTDPVDRLRITHRISEFGAIDEMRVTIEGLRT